MPLTVGGGVRSGRGYPRAAAGGGRQGRDQHRRGRRARSGRPRRREKFGSQCITVAVDAKAEPAPSGPAGRSSPTAAARRPASTPSTWASALAALGAGEILLTSMDRDGTKRRLRPRAHPRHRRCGAGAGDRLAAASARSIIWWKAWPRAMPARCSPPRSSISASIASPRPRRPSPPPGSRSGHERGGFRRRRAGALLRRPGFRHLPCLGADRFARVETSASTTASAIASNSRRRPACAPGLRRIDPDWAGAARRGSHARARRPGRRSPTPR